MSNTITIELCAEDRARLDRIADRLEAQIALTQYMMDNGEPQPAKAAEPDELTAKLQAIVDGAKTEPKAEEEQTPTITPPTEETPTESEPTATVDEITVTRADLGTKVRELMTSGYKEQVKEIVKSYAPTVPGVPEDKVAECYKRLVALEGK